MASDPNIIIDDRYEDPETLDVYAGDVIPWQIQLTDDEGAPIALTNVRVRAAIVQRGEELFYQSGLIVGGEFDPHAAGEFSAAISTMLVGKPALRLLVRVRASAGYETLLNIRVRVRPAPAWQDDDGVGESPGSTRFTGNGARWVISQRGARGYSPGEYVKLARPAEIAGTEPEDFATWARKPAEISGSSALAQVGEAITELGEVTSQKFGELDDALNTAVRTDTDAQDLTEAHRSNARKNIAAIASTDLEARAAPIEQLAAKPTTRIASTAAFVTSLVHPATDRVREAATRGEYRDATGETLPAAMRGIWWHVDAGGRQWALDNGFFKASQFGIVTGVTSQHFRWKAALDYAIAKRRSLRADVRFVLSGTQAQPAVTKVTDPDYLAVDYEEPILLGPQANALYIERTPEQEANVLAVELAQWPAGQNGNWVSRLQLPARGAFAASRIVHIHSTDLYAFDSVYLGTDDVVGAEKAAQHEIMDVQDGPNGTAYVYLRDIVYEAFQTNVKVALLRDYEACDVRLKTYAFGDIDDQAPSVPDVARHIVSEDFGTHSRIELRGDKQWSSGIGLFSCWGGEYVRRGKKGRNLPGKGSYPYGIEVSGACRFNTVTVYASGLRHCFTNVMRNSVGAAAGNSGPLRKKGRQSDISVHGKGWNCTAAIWDTHPGGRRISFVGCEAYFGGLDANAVTAGQTGTQVGYQDRSEETSFVNCLYVGNGRAFALKNKGVTYGRAYTTIISNFVSRIAAEYRDAQAAGNAGVTGPFIFMAGIDPMNTDPWTLEISGGRCGDIPKLIEWTDPLGEGLGKYITVILSGGFRMTDVDRVDVGGATNRLILAGCNRYKTRTTNNVGAAAATMEPILVYNGTTLDIVDYGHFMYNGADAGAAVRATSPAGSTPATPTIIQTSIIRSNQLNSGYRPIVGDGVINFNLQAGKGVSVTKAVDQTARTIGAGASVVLTITSFAGVSSTASIVADSYVDVSFSADLGAGIICSPAWISAAQQVSYRLTNVTAVAINVPTHTAIGRFERRGN